MKQGGNKKVNMMRSDVRSIPRFVFASSEVRRNLFHATKFRETLKFRELIAYFAG
jgi:hypothetical protein